MTGIEMDALLDTRLEDPDRERFVQAKHTQALINAETTIVTLVDNKCLTELETSESNKTASSGILLLSALTDAVRCGQKGVVSVRVHGGKYCRYMTEDELADQENGLYTPTVMNPKYYVYQNRIYLVPTTISNIDVKYLKIPAYNGTQTVLNEMLDNIMVTLAESELWGTARNFDRKKEAYADALTLIATENEKA